MAFLKKSISMFLIMVLSFLFVVQLLQSSDCNGGSGCFNVKLALQEVQHRKMLLEGTRKGQMVFKDGVGIAGAGTITTAGGGGKNQDVWELREAPLGPDPLHHHGGSPKKPRTP